MIVFLFAQQVLATSGNVDFDPSSRLYSFTAGLSCSSTAAACCNLDDTRSANGWGSLFVHTNPSFANDVQAHAAGICEGALTVVPIQEAYTNMGFPMALSAKVKAYVVQNFAWIRKEVKARSQTEDYWSMVDATNQQISGLHIGYNLFNNGTLNIDEIDMWLMSAGSDVGDLIGALDSTRGNSSNDDADVDSKCSALVRFDSATNELFTAQATWTELNMQVRLFKEYDFHFTRINGQRVPGVSIKFSGYPGSVYSGDDFYQIGDHLSVVETTCDVANDTLWQRLQPQSVFVYARAMIANRLARNAVEWAKLFGDFNSGTYNNQWIAVDYARFRARKAAGLDSNTVVLAEQLPGYYRSGDISDIVQQNGHYGSFNVWFFDETFVLSGSPANVKKYGGWFGYNTTARYMIFNRDAPAASTIEDVGALMRYNAFLTDPLSVNPVRSPENAIAARSDLAWTNVTYPFGALGSRCHGATDAKVTSNAYMLNHTVRAIAGPTYGGVDNLPAFQWSTLATTNPCYAQSHVGIPDLLKFDWVLF